MSVIAATVLLALSQETKTFRDKDLGLIFQYPANWEVKKEKYSTNFEFTAADGSTSQIQVFKTQFRQEKATWQQLQREVSEQMRRRVTRQWEEQILGVPLLLTTIEYSDGEAQRSTFVGLLYTATQEKLNFRVNSTAGTAQQAEDAWRGALMTLRTISGELPVPEDPTKPLPNPDTTDSGRPITRLTPDDTGDPVRTKNVTRLEKLGQQLDLYLPDGWALKTEDERIWLTSEKLVGSVEFTVTSGGRVQIPAALKAANDSTFDLYKLVTLREDPVPSVLRSGSFVARTLRVGPGMEGGEVVVLHAVGTTGSVIWRLSYKTDSEAKYKQDRKLLDRLIDYTAVEIAR